MPSKMQVALAPQAGQMYIVAVELQAQAQEWLGTGMECQPSDKGHLHFSPGLVTSNKILPILNLIVSTKV